MWRPINFTSATTSDGGWPGDYAGMTYLINSTQKKGHYSKTFTLNYEFKFSLNLHSFGNSSVTGVYKLSNLQLEKNSAATSYEPYAGTTIPLDWTSTAGTIYGGYVDLITGELVQTHQCRTYDGSSDEGWALSGNDTYVCLQSDVKNNIRNIRPLCDKFLTEQTYGATYTIRPIDNLQYGSTVAEWRTWLASNPIQVVYELATPITHQLTPTQLKSLRGINNIWSNANGNIEVQYWTH